jgi:hypothetical protein
MQSTPSPNTPAPLLINEIEAARLLGVSQRFLQKDRAGARSIPFVRVGCKFVKYSPAALAKFAIGDAQ